MECEYSYSAYGTRTVVNGYESVLGYCARDGVLTENGGLCYMRARYYSPELMRFVNQDIVVGDISNSNSLNRYTYVEGNPATMVDPFGLCANKSNSIGNSLLKGSEYALIKMLYESGAGKLCKGLAVISRQIFYGESRAIAEMNADAPVDEYLQLLADSAGNQIAFDIGRYGTDLATLCSGVGLIVAGAGEEGGAVAFAAGTGGAGAPVAIAVAPAAAAQIGVGVDVTRVATSELFSPHVSVGGSSNASTSSGSGNSSNHMIGENGTQTTSKTTWEKGKTERIDVENPNPGERPGQIHYHDSNNNKYYYDISEGTFYNQKTGEQAPNAVNDLLNDKEFWKGIQKGIKILGE